ncbi:hypothetical protein MBLNU230_g6270t1 [Neophaeotheca triangularis]
MAIHPSRQAYVEEGNSKDEEGVSMHDLGKDSPPPEVEKVHFTYTFQEQNPAQYDAQRMAAAEALDRNKRMRQMHIPTADNDVKLELRKRGEPITLFGEGKIERRDRLRHVMFAEKEVGTPDEDVSMMDQSEQEEPEDEQAEFYTIGTDALLEARKDIARYSLPRAQRRIAYQKVESTIKMETHVKHRAQIKSKLKNVELFGSQIASARPMSMARFSPNGEIIACGDWNGSVKLLDVPNLEMKANLRGHTGVVGGITWYPGPTTPDGLNLATTGGEGSIHFWSMEKETPIATLSGHSARVTRADFHPSGKYLASAAYDTTWRLWDVETQKELLMSEGHSREAFQVGFNCDGSLLASAGLDSIGRIWDIRSGRTIMMLEGHVQPIHGLSWSPDGHRVITGSSDGFAKCWDIRQVRETANIGAHRNGVADVRWFQGQDAPLSGAKMVRDEEGVLKPRYSGSFVVTGGMDKNVNIFAADSWDLVKTLTGHDGNVQTVDISSDGKWIVSSSRDRTVKLWARDNMDSLYE